MIYAGRFQGRAAVITGGASGLGLESAKRITQEGGKVCLWDLDADALAAAKKETGAVHSIALDVSDAKAVEAAAAAFPAWMETPPVERVRILGRFKMLMEENFEDIVRSNTREHGKTLAESRGDVKRGMEVVEFALGVPSLMMGEVLENVARGID